MYYLGVDLGGTNIAVGLLNEDGKMIFKDTVSTLKERHADEIIKDMANLCIRILQQNNIDIKKLHSVGIGSPGVCDYENTTIVYSNNIKFENYEIGKEFKKHLNVPVYLDNDANCAAYGESISGACKNTKNSVTITLGTGVGSGVIVNGQILRGFNGGAGEIGHHVIVVDGEQCTCGRKGCFESYCSATALIRDILTAILKNPDCLLAKAIENNHSKINAKIVFDMADKGDEVSKILIDNYIKFLAEGLVNIINIFQPEVIAIGGGIAAQGEKMLKPVRAMVKERCYANILETKIVEAELSNDAGIIGAAFLGKY